MFQSDRIQPEKKPASLKKICAWTACAIWALSIVLSFSIAPRSEWIWLPDAVLLLGFFPLLWICPYSLVWIAFGILTGFIGLFLLILTNIPDPALPAQTHSVKRHLAEYHPYWSWMIIGVLVTVCGTIRFAVNAVLYLMKRSAARKRS